MYAVNPGTTIEDCMALITEKRIRHIPVFDKDSFVGLISIGDILKSTIVEKEDVIEQLSNYIAGKY
jgi:predicted transcriptional regulator